MVLGEISQAEVWDPVCHNLPNPSKVLDLLRNSDNVPGVDAICDFWGHRGPFIAHANHAAMAQYFAGSSGSPEEHLRLAAGIHYGVSSQALIDDALTCWRLFDTVVDEWALNLWPQRFSYAIGRDAARGFLYRALIPQNLRAMDQSWACRTLQTLDIDVGEFAKYQEEDRSAFVGMSAAFDRFADKMEALSLPSCAIARREARNIELAGEMIGSIGRTFSAYMAYKECDGKRLRTVVEAEIDARERQLQISGRIGWGAGVNPLLVTEDIQNMRLFLSRDDFPNPPDECFHFTETPYSV